MNSKLVGRLDNPEEVDKIIQWINDPVKYEHNLTPKLEEKLLRINAANSLINKYGSRKRVVPMLKVQFPEMSEYTLVRDYYDAKEVFNSTSLKQKEYDREMWYQWLMDAAYEAKTAKDWKNFAALADKAYKFGQFYLEEDEQAPLYDLEPHEIILTTDPSILGIEKVQNLEHKKKRLAAKLKKKQASWDDIAEEANEE